MQKWCIEVLRENGKFSSFWVENVYLCKGKAATVKSLENQEQSLDNLLTHQVGDEHSLTTKTLPVCT